MVFIITVFMLHVLCILIVFLNIGNILDNRYTGERCTAIYSYTDGEPVCELSDISIQKEQGVDEVFLNDGGYEIRFGQ